MKKKRGLNHQPVFIVRGFFFFFFASSTTMASEDLVQSLGWMVREDQNATSAGVSIKSKILASLKLVKHNYSQRQLRSFPLSPLDHLGSSSCLARHSVQYRDGETWHEKQRWIWIVRICCDIHQRPSWGGKRPSVAFKVFLMASRVTWTLHPKSVAWLGD